MFRFAIDRGGTFTDIYAECPNGSVRVMKLLSEDPANYPDAPREGIRRILEEQTGESFPKDKPIDASCIEWIRMGTTVATNALLERKGEPIALAITAGMRDLLHVGTQARPKIFDLEIDVPEVLYKHVIEVKERLILHDGSKDDEGVISGVTGELLKEEVPLDEDALRHDLKAVFETGVKCLSVVLMHSYLHSSNEERVAEMARGIGFEHVSLSSQVMRMAKIVPRGYTSCADAYLTPCIHRYVKGFCKGFKDDLKDVQVLFMQSDGGLTPVANFNGSRAILSGPAGGVVGYAKTAYTSEDGRAVIGFDMGGTSTDVSRFAGTYDHVFESTTAGVTIQAPQLDINTVAAGGGSCLTYRAGMFAVGPESAGAHPGPTCYRKGGPLTVTDANLFLGRIQAKHFPYIFGESEDQPLDFEASAAAFQSLTQTINEDPTRQGPPMTPQEVALGFLRVANEAMCRPIRALTQAKGYDTTAHVLSCFGGAGGQHACAIARSLGMTKIKVHRYSGILSAYGIAVANVVCEQTAPSATRLSGDNFIELKREILRLAEEASIQMRKQGFLEESFSFEPFLNMRYEGTDCAMMTPPGEADGSVNLNLSALTNMKVEEFRETFNTMYKREFGFVINDRSIIVDDIRVRLTAKHEPTKRVATKATTENSMEKVRVSFDDVGAVDCMLYHIDEVSTSEEITGPAILLGGNTTLLVEPGCSAVLNEFGDVTITVGDGIAQRITTALNAVHLSIFGHRFMSIAEQMGRALQRTSISVNIKERLDFSCALFSPSGGLVANAPHIPVHLGAMQEAVRYQIEHLKGNVHPGDVLVSNHPCAGGSHLPDITVMTPVFRSDGLEPVFYVASRGHHADIGGTTPGSMPPNSTSLNQEGAAIISFKIVTKANGFDEQGITELLMAPEVYEGSSGTRKLSDNLSDLKAQVAANNRGITLVNELIDECGIDVVLAYMNHIQENAESAVREMLRNVADRALGSRDDATAKLHAVDFMDDGSKIELTVDINKTNGNARFDFTGTTDEIMGNTNAPRAVTYSAIIYCLRCMVGFDLPLNQGCLAPITIHIPEGSMLYPSENAAVVGGNVLTSQRVTDVVLKAFESCAASQGCMNNITFGDETMGYYETVAGGAGAGPSWNGRSGIHTHMTNTRITDPEILERRYPVILDIFKLRDGSGGKGKFCGGDGVVRQLRFRRPLTLSVLTERRVHRPYGLKGGLPGSAGINTLLKKEKNGVRRINLGPKRTVKVGKGDAFLLLTPGGGGFGVLSDDVEELEDMPPKKKQRLRPQLAGGSLGKYTETQLDF